MPTATYRTTETERPTLLVVVVAIVSVLALGLGVAHLGGDDGAPADAAASFAPVAVTGEPLARLGDGGDVTLGTDAPTLTGSAPDGGAVIVGPSGSPTVVAFLAHWCPTASASSRCSSAPSSTGSSTAFAPWPC